MMKYDMLTINTTSTVKTPNQEFTPKKSTAKNSTKHSSPKILVSTPRWSIKTFPHPILPEPGDQFDSYTSWNY